MNKLHKWALWPVHDDFKTSLMDLLLKGGSLTAHHRNIQILLLETNKIKHHLSESCVNDLFSV